MNKFNKIQTMQPVVRKVSTVQHQIIPSQMNAIKKVNNLMQSGSVSFSQPKIIRQRIITTTTASQPQNTYATTNNSAQQQYQMCKCFICDEQMAQHMTRNLSETKTLTTAADLPNKIASVVGDSFMVIVGVDDVICRRCYGLFNQMDKMEMELERVRGNIKSFINKKYNINDEEQPPIKMQKLNSGMPAYSNATRTLQQQNSSSADEGVSSPVTRKIVINPTHNTSDSLNSSTSPSTPAQRRQPVKLYKCVSCDFKTTNLNAFQPHYEECKGNQNKLTTTTSSSMVTTASTVSANAKCLKCNKTYLNTTLLNRHIQETHGEVIKKEESPKQLIHQQQHHQQIQQNTIYSCQQCQYKTQDKQNFDQHQAKHIKMKPFKCRLCLQRFETREQATIHAKTHAPTYFKCGICDLAFNKKGLLDEHLKIHDVKDENKAVKIIKKVSVPQPQAPVPARSTQMMLKETIEEALRTDDSTPIQFHSCQPCNLTFLNDKLYRTHMQAHEPVKVTRKIIKPADNKQKLVKEKVEQPQQQQQNTLTDGDLESIFEKMHSEAQGATNGTSADGNVLITTQESGGITYNITIPQDPPPQTAGDQKSLGIDMPTLDQQEDDSQVHDEEHQQQPPVSMPSLDEDDNSQTSQGQEQEQTATLTVENPDGTVTTQTIPVNLHDLQNAAEEGQQIKFILDNGQLLQLDNHILTDADGNQILVQGGDPEQFQQLLQSVGVVMQGNGEGMVADNEHTTLQMIDENNQMILVQSGDGQETRLIDASMLSGEGGNIVIQQGADGETHLTTADGIPVSVAFTDHNQEGIVSGGEEGGQISVAITGEGEEQQFVLQQPMQLEGEQPSDDSQTAVAEQDHAQSQSGEDSQEPTEEASADESAVNVPATPSGEVTSTTETTDSAAVATEPSESEVKQEGGEEAAKAEDAEKTEESEKPSESAEKTEQSEQFFSLGEIMQPKEEVKEEK